MKVIATPFTNMTFKLPGGTTANDLPVEVTTDAEENPVLLTTWQLDDEERARVARGEPIELLVWGSGHPPVTVRVAE